MVVKLNLSSNAVLEGRTVFKTKIYNSLFYSSNILKSADLNSKLGKGKYKIKKGKWKNFPLFSLTLEERKTCPKECYFWINCYGNNLYLSHRFKNNKDLLERLDIELRRLANKYQKGFVLRLHILGDFYSLNYIRFWERQLKRYGNLYVFGYTARVSGKFRRALSKIRLRYPERWWVRYSQNKSYSTYSPNVIYAAREAFKGESILCPEQIGKTESCLTCGLCWTIKKSIRFLEH